MCNFWPQTCNFYLAVCSIFVPMKIKLLLLFFMLVVEMVSGSWLSVCSGMNLYLPVSIQVPYPICTSRYSTGPTSASSVSNSHPPAYLLMAGIFGIITANQLLSQPYAKRLNPITISLK